MADLDYTEIFNEARVKAGKEPTHFTIILIHEGMTAGCECPIIRSNGKTFTIRHDLAICKYGREGKQRVGDGIHNAIGSLQGEPFVIPMTDPWCGLFPYEQ